MGGRADDPGERLRPQQHAEAPLRRHRGVGDRLRFHDAARSTARTASATSLRRSASTRTTSSSRSRRSSCGASSRRRRRPVAGRPFTLKLVAARSDTGAAVQNGRVTCVGRVGAARLKAQLQRVQGGAATCTWNIPAGREGQDVPWIGDGGVRRAEGRTELHGQGSLDTAAGAPPRAPRLTRRCRRHHRHGGRFRRSNAEERRRARAAEGPAGSRPRERRSRPAATACA